MGYKMLSASFSVGEGESRPEFRFHPQINILCGKYAEDVVLNLAGIFSGKSTWDGTAKLLLPTGEELCISVIGGACLAERIVPQRGNSANQVKDFHKLRFLNFRKIGYILDGAKLPEGFGEATDLLLERLQKALTQKDDSPLFICNFLERLDEATDLAVLFEELKYTGRQIFLAVPHFYSIKILEAMYYDKIIYTH